MMMMMTMVTGGGSDGGVSQHRASRKTAKMTKRTINQSINQFRHTQQIYTIYKTKVMKTFTLCVTGSTQGA